MVRASRRLCLHSRSNCFSALQHLLLFLIMWAKAVETGLCQRHQWNYAFCLGSLCCRPFALLWWVSLWASNRHRDTPALLSTTTLNNNHYLMRTRLLRAFNAVFKSRHRLSPINACRVFGAKIRVWRVTAFLNLMLLSWKQTTAFLLIIQKEKKKVFDSESRGENRQFTENLLKLWLRGTEDRNCQNLLFKYLWM